MTTSRWYPALIGLFLVLFSFMLYVQLSARPLHSDEGVNGHFLKNLITERSYRYDPMNYHGPTLYYFQLIPTWINTLIKEKTQFRFSSISGLSPASLRAGTAFVGLLVLIGLLCAHVSIGSIGALAAFLLAGFSLDLIYIARYFIHEIYVVFFTLGIYLSAVYWERYRKPVYWISSVLSAVLLFCTKETSVIVFSVLALSYLCKELTIWLLTTRSTGGFIQNLIRDLKDALPSKRLFGFSVILAIAVWFTFFTSFFTNMAGAIDSFRSFTFWSKEGIESGHNKPVLYFLERILIRYETAPTILTLIGIAIAFTKVDPRGLFISFWALGMLAAHSLIPYKTPWLVVNILLPFYLVAGYAVQQSADFLSDPSRKIAGRTTAVTWTTAFAVLLLLQFPQTLRVLYKEFDSNQHEQPYVHTTQGMVSMVKDIERTAQDMKLGKDIKINVVSRDYWPLPFYLREYKEAKFWGQISNIGVVDAPLIVVADRDRETIKEYLKDDYTMRSFAFRPGLTQFLYINQKYLPGRFMTSDLISDDILTHGLLQEIFKGREFEGRAGSVFEGTAYLNFNWRKEDLKPYKPPFGIRWTGFLRAPAEGDYRFTLESDDGSWIRIDNQMAVDNGGVHALNRISRTLTLSKGLHKFELYYFDIGGEAVLNVEWAFESKPSQALTNEYLFFVPSGR